MEYNTQRKRLPMPEYGRSIQNMVDHALTITDRAERQKCANTIVRIMRNMNPSMHDVPGFDNKLWDHLAIMSDYKLDIDYPCEITPRDTFERKPSHIDYPKQNIRFRHYGHFLEELIKVLADYEEGPEKECLLELVANQMKRSLAGWNKDAMDDAKIAADLAVYTKGRIRLDLSTFRFANISQNRQGVQQTNGRKKKKK